MRALTKKAIIIGSTLAVTSSVAMTVDVQAASSPEEVVFSYDGTDFTVSWDEYINLLSFKEGDMYNLIQNSSTTVAGINMGGNYIDYDLFVNKVIDEAQVGSGKDSLEILVDIQSDSSYHMPDSEVEAIEEVTDIVDGEPQFGSVVVPEVISID